MGQRVRLYCLVWPAEYLIIERNGRDGEPDWFFYHQHLVFFLIVERNSPPVKSYSCLNNANIYFTMVGICRHRLQNHHHQHYNHTNNHHHQHKTISGCCAALHFTELFEVGSPIAVLELFHCNHHRHYRQRNYHHRHHCLIHFMRFDGCHAFPTLVKKSFVLLSIIALPLHFPNTIHSPRNLFGPDFLQNLNSSSSGYNIIPPCWFNLTPFSFHNSTRHSFPPP